MKNRGPRFPAGRPERPEPGGPGPGGIAGAGGSGRPPGTIERGPRPGGRRTGGRGGRPIRQATPTGPAGRPRRALAPWDPEAVIQTRGLTRRYGRFTAVDHLDLTIGPGEIFGLLGPNGAGKTTTVLMLLGLSEPSAGEARVLGLDPTRDPIGVKRQVGYLPDNVGFYGDMSGRQNLRYTAALNGLKGREAEDRIDRLLAEVRLTDAADKRVDQYSRGMRQRVGIADALMADPRVLILDEPTIAIDPAGVAEILSLITGLVRDRGLTVLLASHLLEQVQSICTRVGIFVAGRMIAQGTVAELARLAPASDVTIEVEIFQFRSGAQSFLKDIPGVVGVAQHEHDPDRWLVHARRDIRTELAAAIIAGGHQLAHLQRRGEQLDAIYRRFVSVQDAGTDRGRTSGGTGPRDESTSEGTLIPAATAGHAGGTTDAATSHQAEGSKRASRS